MNPWIATLLFIITFVADNIWVKYNNTVASRLAIRASSYGVALWLFSAVSVVSYVHDRWYMLPIVIGSWLGTYVAVKRS